MMDDSACHLLGKFRGKKQRCSLTRIVVEHSKVNGLSIVVNTQGIKVRVFTRCKRLHAASSVTGSGKTSSTGLPMALAMAA
jgi:hypothetical protein